jgi:hypothetical protein
VNRGWLVAISLLALAAFAATPAAQTRTANTAATSTAGCSVPTTEALVQTFVRDFNAGEVAAIDRLWAREPYFQWFSSAAPGARLGPAPTTAPPSPSTSAHGFARRNDSA